MNFYPRSPCGERQPPRVIRKPATDFYPRSPCGERPCTTTITICIASFLSTLSLRRATYQQTAYFLLADISIHALLAESDTKICPNLVNRIHFYPRSPCGERQQIKQICRNQISISIHALLAESDSKSNKFAVTELVFLSTLSLRRATR